MVNAPYGTLQETASISLNICSERKVTRRSLAKQRRLATDDISQKNLLQKILFCCFQGEVFARVLGVFCKSEVVRKNSDNGTTPSAIDEVDEIDVDIAKSLRPFHQYPYLESHSQVFRLTNLHCLIESGCVWILSSEQRVCSCWSFPG